MKFFIGLLVVIFKFYCSFKIFQWIYYQFVDKSNHPINEVQHFIVFIILDIWLMLSVSQLEKIDDIKV
jgi:hypothetical protein